MDFLVILHNSLSNFFWATSMLINNIRLIKRGNVIICDYILSFKFYFNCLYMEFKFSIYFMGENF